MQVAVTTEFLKGQSHLSLGSGYRYSAKTSLKLHLPNYLLMKLSIMNLLFQVHIYIIVTTGYQYPIGTKKRLQNHYKSIVCMRNNDKSAD